MLLLQIEDEKIENRNIIYNLLIYIFKKKNILISSYEFEEIYEIIKYKENLIKLLYEEKKNY